MVSPLSHPDLQADLPAATGIGFVPLFRLAFAGGSLQDIAEELAAVVLQENVSPLLQSGALLDLASIHLMLGDRTGFEHLQSQALRLQRIHRRPAQPAGAERLRVLALMVNGDTMSNTPLEFLLEGSDITLDLCYCNRDQNLPDRIPEHDLAFVAVAESTENRSLLLRLVEATKGWPRPVLNSARQILQLTRDGVSTALQGVEGLVVPPTVCVGREALLAVAQATSPLTSCLPETSFPILVRPNGSHAGHGLERIQSAHQLRDYLADETATSYYVTAYQAYQSLDGQFRKYRIALVDGHPLAVHMAISSHWMVHYLNAGMDADPDKRAEEARFFESFDHNFAQRHRVALTAMCERLGLDYFAIDCGELPDGRLLLFEADTAMIVHATDSVERYPYKQPQMRKVFAAFRALLLRRAGKGDSPA